MGGASAPAELKPSQMIRRFILAFVPLVLASPLAAAAEGKADPIYAVPRFRHVDAAAKPPKFDTTRKLTLLADEDFPPFSYADSSGSPKGVAVDLGLTLCARLQLQCSVRLLRWDDLRSALAQGEGDAVISGFAFDDPTLAQFDPTRPLYRALGRFAVRTQNPIDAPSIRLLAGKRLGVAKNTQHEAWLKKYFYRSQILSYDRLADAEEALRSAKVDAIFGDSLSLVYWTRGQSSQSCCRLVSGAFVDEEYFSRGFAFFVRRGDTSLKKVLDYGLDRLQESGDWEKIFRLYVPDSPW